MRKRLQWWRGRRRARRYQAGGRRIVLRMEPQFRAGERKYSSALINSEEYSRRKEPYNMPRQELPEVYWQTGYVDAAWADTILSTNSMTGSRILPLIIDPSEWIDIDSPDDWRRAERLLESGEITLSDLGFEL